MRAIVKAAILAVSVALIGSVGTVSHRAGRSSLAPLQHRKPRLHSRVRAWASR